MLTRCRRIWAASWILAAFALASEAGARAPLLDETRGVLTLAPMLEQVTPAVVNIAVVTRVATEDNPLQRDPFFRKFFGIPENAPGSQTRRALAAGSGVIVDAAKGLIVTNHHVIKDAETIAVTLKDGRQLKAELVGSDPATEVAVVKVAAAGLTSITLADSDQLKVGDVVLAIGNPFGVGQTVTSGIISALGRSGLTADNYEDFIQTDAPINPGNCGGRWSIRKANSPALTPPSSPRAGAMSASASRSPPTWSGPLFSKSSGSARCGVAVSASPCSRSRSISPKPVGSRS